MQLPKKPARAVYGKGAIQRTGLPRKIIIGRQMDTTRELFAELATNLCQRASNTSIIGQVALNEFGAGRKFIRTFTIHTHDSITKGKTPHNGCTNETSATCDDNQLSCRFHRSRLRGHAQYQNW